jgi:hypothetical protein
MVLWVIVGLMAALTMGRVCTIGERREDPAVRRAIADGVARDHAAVSERARRRAG